MALSVFMSVCIRTERVRDPDCAFFPLCVNNASTIRKEVRSNQQINTLLKTESIKLQHSNTLDFTFHEAMGHG